MQHTWIDLCIAAVLSLPAIIAAVSSLRNGKHLEKLNGAKEAQTLGFNLSSTGSGSASQVKKQPIKNGSHPDWYEPFDP